MTTLASIVIALSLLATRTVRAGSDTSGLRAAGLVLLALSTTACSPVDAGVPLDLGALHAEITNYPVMCEVDLVAGDCPRGHGLPLNWTTYKVYVHEQMVIATPRAGGADKYTDCAVSDRQNWRCTADDYRRTFGFSNGRYWESSKDSGSPLDETWKRVIYVSVADYTAHAEAFEKANREANMR
jgi:hypothetical protein